MDNLEETRLAEGRRYQERRKLFRCSSPPSDGQENIHRLWNGLSSDDATESIFPFLASVLDEEIQSLETEDDRLVALLLLQGATIQGIADSMDRSFSTARIMRTRVLETLRMRLMQKLDQRD